MAAFDDLLRAFIVEARSEQGVSTRTARPLAVAIERTELQLKLAKRLIAQLTIDDGILDETLAEAEATLEPFDIETPTADAESIATLVTDVESSATLVDVTSAVGAARALFTTVQTLAATDQAFDALLRVLLDSVTIDMIQSRMLTDAQFALAINRRIERWMEITGLQAPDSKPNRPVTA